jgi:uncharacterized protein (TIGR04255 family)
MMKLHKSPLFYTLAQVKFNTIGQIGDYALRIQEHLRLHGYPDFRPITRTDLVVMDNEQIKAETQLFKQQSWHFINSDTTEGYILFADSLTFHTTLYNSFEDFLKKMLNGLNIVHDVIGLAFIERIGLRYLNAIRPMQDNDKLTNYLNNSLLGFSRLSKGSIIHSFTETVASVNDGTLISRAAISESGLIIPRDLHPMQLKIQDEFTTLTGTLAVLDLDYYINQRINFKREIIKEKLTEFHNVITSMFHDAVTDHALKIWR